MKQKKVATIALVAAMAIGTLGFSVPTKAAENSTDYTITIPATLSVANAGWNATDGITAKVKEGDSFDTSKTLTVTAASTNSWALKSGENSVGYNLATAEAAYSASATPASWDFSADELNASGGTNKVMGINVQDYTTMAIPAGEYKDTVTFTAKVLDARTPVTAITLNKNATNIAVGNSETLSVSTVTPDNATDKTVTWSSDNETVATVNATTGEVTAVSMGTANITATANDGSGVTATCAVNVNTVVVIWNYNDIIGSGNSFTKDGVTVTAGRYIDFRDKNVLEGGTFTTTLGNFTKIVVSGGFTFAGPNGTGWSNRTWTGNASSVTFTSDIMGAGQGDLKFVFTIGPVD